MDLKTPPAFDGKNFSQYKIDVRMWNTVTDIPANKRAILAAMQCSGEAKLFINSLDFDRLKDENGMTYLYESLQKEF